MQEIHSKVFNHLRQNYPDLTFTLRKIDRGGRLGKGYWFLGNDDYLTLSFWQGEDWGHKTPNIIFTIYASHKTEMEIMDYEQGKKNVFFQKIAKPLKMNPVKNRDKEGMISKWRRIYSEPQTNYLIALDSFINNEKILIDALISVSNIPELSPINKQEFEKSLQFIEKWQQKRQPVMEPPPKVAALSIEKLKLTNISHFDTLVVDLHPHITCFIGENGSGKTTLLRAIVLGLVGFSNGKFVREDVEKLQYELTSFLKIQKAQNQSIEYAANGKIELFYNKDKKNVIQFQCASEGVDTEGRLKLANDVEMDDSESDFDALDKEGYFKNLVLGFAQIRGVSDATRAQDFANKKASLSAIYSLLYNRNDSSFAQVENWISQAFDWTRPERERLQTIEILKQAFKIMSQIAGENIELGDMTPQKQVIPFVKTPDAPHGIPLNLVSQGYENLIGWVGYLVKRLADVTPEGQNFMETAAICFIDELDTYLHPKWQRNLLKVLTESFKNVQFIVTTHSPLSITHLKNLNDDVWIYQISRNGVQKIQAAGQDISTALRMHFGIERRPSFYQAKIDKLFEDFEKWEAAQDGVTIESLEKQLVDLEKWLGNYDPDVETATRILEALKI
jgi:predicted ATP-binding protein involved in virulence